MLLELSNRRGLGWFVRVWFATLVMGVCSLAQASEPDIISSGLHRSDQGLRLNVRLALKATPAVEQALIKGVPMYFVWRADLIRDRWYWTDKREIAVSRTLRLAYQPLTRRWRLSVASEPEMSAGAGLTYALHQNFDSLTEALSVVGRVSNWQIAEARHLSDTELRVQWQFALDLALLPRPFQLGMANEPEWDIAVRQRIDVLPHADLDPEPAPSMSSSIKPANMTPAEVTK